MTNEQPLPTKGEKTHIIKKLYFTFLLSCYIKRFNFSFKNSIQSLANIIKYSFLPLLFCVLIYLTNELYIKSFDIISYNHTYNTLFLEERLIKDPRNTCITILLSGIATVAVLYGLYYANVSTLFLSKYVDFPKKLQEMYLDLVSKNNIWIISYLCTSIFLCIYIFIADFSNYPVLLISWGIITAIFIIIYCKILFRTSGYLDSLALCNEVQSRIKNTLKCIELKIFKNEYVQDKLLISTQNYFEIFYYLLEEFPQNQNIKSYLYDNVLQKNIEIINYYWKVKEQINTNSLWFNKNATIEYKQITNNFIIPQINNNSYWVENNLIFFNNIIINKLIADKTKLQQHINSIEKIILIHHKSIQQITALENLYFIYNYSDIFKEFYESLLQENINNLYYISINYGILLELYVRKLLEILKSTNQDKQNINILNHLNIILFFIKKLYDYINITYNKKLSTETKFLCYNYIRIIICTYNIIKIKSFNEIYIIRNHYLDEINSRFNNIIEIIHSIFDESYSAINILTQQTSFHNEILKCLFQYIKETLIYYDTNQFKTLLLIFYEILSKTISYYLINANYYLKITQDKNSIVTDRIFVEPLISCFIMIGCAIQRHNAFEGIIINNLLQFINQIHSNYQTHWNYLIEFIKNDIAHYENVTKTLQNELNLPQNPLLYGISWLKSKGL